MSFIAPSAPQIGYRGRFAPTPSGPLHLGSLLTALASWLDARTRNGDWLLRIDDLDVERTVPGAADCLQRQLEAHGLYWDGRPRYQSEHLDEYGEALEQLRRVHLLYACRCTRAQLRHSAREGIDGPVYPGTCRRLALPEPGHALRLRAGSGAIGFDDRWQGRQSRDLDCDIGDFVVWRRDGVAAYQLACAVDEAALGITDIVRGADLLGSTFRQLRVMDLLGLRRPAYAHLPVLCGADGRKLSKQNRAAPIDERDAGANLQRCLHWLGQELPASGHSAPPRELLQWALRHWTPGRVPAVQRLKVEHCA
ncbi:MAG: tRNA glutamyl-Q(34) synthetase GluQRS [Gammaproteobacteria bacterium]